MFGVVKLKTLPSVCETDRLSQNLKTRDWKYTHRHDMCHSEEWYMGAVRFLNLKVDSSQNYGSHNYHQLNLGIHGGTYAFLRAILCEKIFSCAWYFAFWLTHWGRVTHICVSKLTIIGSDNGLSPGRRQAIIRTNAGILLIRPLGTNFSKFLVEILICSFKKMRLKVSSAKRRPFCLGLNELTRGRVTHRCMRQ